MRQMGLSDRNISHARKAEQRLKVLLQQYPQTKLRPEAELRLREVQDTLAEHNFNIAIYYRDHYINKKGGLKGSQDRLKEIMEKYAKYFDQLGRDYPNSQFVDKAKDQLNVIGAAIPEPDPIKKNLPTCHKPTFM